MGVAEYKKDYKLNMTVTIFTSLYQSDAYLKSYAAAIKKFVAAFGGDIDLDILAIANDPTETELLGLRKLAESLPVFRFVVVPRESIYASWNRAVSLAHGEYLTSWNVDDSRFGEAIIDGADLLGKGYDLVYFPFRYKRYVTLMSFDLLVKSYIVRPPAFDRNEFVRSMHSGPFFMFTKEFYHRVGPFDEQFKISGDFDWCARAARVGKFALSEIVAGKFINKGNSLSGSRDERHIVENNIICKRQGVLDKINNHNSNLYNQYKVDSVLLGDKFNKINS